MITIDRLRYLILTCIYETPREGYTFTEKEVYNRLKDCDDDEKLNVKIGIALSKLDKENYITSILQTKINPSTKIADKTFQITKRGEEEIAKIRKELKNSDNKQ